VIIFKTKISLKKYAVLDAKELSKTQIKIWLTYYQILFNKISIKFKKTIAK